MTLESVLFPTQKELFKMLTKHKLFNQKYTYRKNEYFMVWGDLPVLLVAHLDTVHKEPVKDLCMTEDKNILMSPQGIGGDDRCGVYALLTLYDTAENGKKPSLLFTCDEEIGGNGALNFCDDVEQKCFNKEETEKLDALKCIIEIDRKGHEDAVYYECDNEDFEKYITSKGFRTDHGSFSDISLIAPALKIAAVNLSSGYYNAHTNYEYINRKHLEDTIGKVKNILKDLEDGTFPRYKYVPCRTGKIRSIFPSYDRFWDLGYDKYEDSKKTYEENKLDTMLTVLQDYYSPEDLDNIMQEDGIEMIEMMYEEALSYETGYNGYERTYRY